MNAREKFNTKSKEKQSIHSVVSNNPLQQIIYGAPGTGKSYQIKENISNSPHFRTTFHPDSDYSSFVGAYKPTMTKVEVRDVNGKVIIENGNKIKEDKIVYKYVAQSFLEAYIAAWKSYPKKQYLIIEEINRGNCAQIFGDLFQLLDRNSSGFSDYPIQADNDIHQYIHAQLLDFSLSEEYRNSINDIYTEEYNNVVEKIIDGEVLLLPSNLCIWATMNTSDQSLFPIDSAFKRRWDWKYIPISNTNKGWAISANGNKYDWWSFLEKINEKIGSTTESEDKKLGYFFVKAEDGQSIAADKFVGKVIFYLWNDVFKDYGFEDNIFKDTDDDEILSFQKFFTPKGTANERKVEIFLKNLGVSSVIVEEDIDLIEDANGNSNNDNSRYSFNGDEKLNKSVLGLNIMKKYIQENKLTFDKLKSIFPDSMLNNVGNRGLIAKDDIDFGSYSRYYTKTKFMSSDNVNFFIYKQWTINNIQNIIDFADSQGWKVEKVLCDESSN